MCHPLPHDLLVLNEVQLKNGFVGYFKKVGILFLEFQDGMHIGSNSVILTGLTCAHSIQITEARLDNYRLLAFYSLLDYDIFIFIDSIFILKIDKFKVVINLNYFKMKFSNSLISSNLSETCLRKIH